MFTYFLGTMIGAVQVFIFKARQGKARQGKARQGKARQGRRVETIDGKYGRVVCFMFDVWFEKKEGDQYQYIDNVRC